MKYWSHGERAQLFRIQLKKKRSNQKSVLNYHESSWIILLQWIAFKMRNVNAHTSWAYAPWKLVVARHVHIAMMQFKDTHAVCILAVIRCIFSAPSSPDESWRRTISVTGSRRPRRSTYLSSCGRSTAVFVVHKFIFDDDVISAAAYRRGAECPTDRSKLKTDLKFATTLPYRRGRVNVGQRACDTWKTRIHIRSLSTYRVNIPSRRFNKWPGSPSQRLPRFCT